MYVCVTIDLSTYKTIIIKELFLYYILWKMQLCKIQILSDPWDDQKKLHGS